MTPISDGRSHSAIAYATKRISFPESRRLTKKQIENENIGKIITSKIGIEK